MLMLAIFFLICSVLVYGFLYWMLKTKKGQHWLASL